MFNSKYIQYACCALLSVSSSIVSVNVNAADTDTNEGEPLVVISSTTRTDDEEYDSATDTDAVTEYSEPTYELIPTPKIEYGAEFIEVTTVNGPQENHITKQGGKFFGPSGKETWYNLPMGKCIDIMRGYGYSVEEYPYWVRKDGVKMLGEYVMVAANTSVYPKGTVVETSLGTGIVVDHCVRATYDPGVDICVTW